MRIARKAADGHLVGIRAGGSADTRLWIHDVPFYRPARHDHVRQDLPRGDRATDVLEQRAVRRIERAPVRILQLKAVRPYLHPRRLGDYRQAPLGICAADQVFRRTAQAQRFRRPVVGPALAAACADIDAVDGNPHLERRGRRRAAHRCMVGVSANGEVVFSVRQIQVCHARGV